MATMEFHLTFALVLGLVAAGLALLSHLMKNMLPLRAVALGANVLFIVYFYIEWQLPSMVLQGALLVVNVVRLQDIIRLVRNIRGATEDTPVSEWLVPHMSRKRMKAGEVLFRKGDVADELIYIAAGKVRLPEFNVVLGPGELIGEIALFSPEKKRTQTIVCETDVDLRCMTDEMIYQLYFLNPELAFFLMRLIVKRLMRDIQRMRPVGETPAQPAAASPGPV
jgi:CRP/FNR family cyclic AMP-dependent transcriptional regulator